MTLSDLEWLCEIFNDTKHCAASLRQLSFFYLTIVRSVGEVCCALPVTTRYSDVTNMKQEHVIVRLKVLQFACDSYSFTSRQRPVYILFCRCGKRSGTLLLRKKLGERERSLKSRSQAQRKFIDLEHKRWHNEWPTHHANALGHGDKPAVHSQSLSLKRIPIISSHQTRNVAHLI